MTRKELASKIQSLDSHNRLRLAIGLTIIGLWLIAGALLDNLMNWGGSQTLRYGYGILGIIIFFAFLLSLAVLQRGVPCPHCKKRLFGIPGQIAVATGVCGYCGERVFE